MLDIVTSIDIYRIYRPVFTAVRYFESIHCPVYFPACIEIGVLMLDIVTSIDIYRIYRPVFTGVRYFESIHGWRCHGPINFPAYTEIGRWADAGHQIFDIIILLIRSCSDGKYENTFWREKRNIERHLQW